MRALSIALVLGACATPPPQPDATPAVPSVDPTAAAAPTTNAEPQAQQASAAETPAGSEWVVFGSEFAEGQPTSLSALLAEADAHTNKTVQVEGKVSEVCQKAGCWMVVSEGEQHMRIRMKDHSFAVDKAGAGRACQVQGTLVAKTIDPSEVAHYASETRAGGVVPETGLKGVTYEIEADSVRMRAGS